MRELILNTWKKKASRLITLVDDKDYRGLNQYRWFAHKHKNTYYAERQIRLPNGKQKVIKMHREIMQTPDNILCDHKNHNGLDNQRHNLRNCTHQQNTMNHRAYGKSPYIGVSFREGRIIARITFNKKTYYLGGFPTEKDAAKAYDSAATNYFKEFANLNFPII